MAVQFQPVIVNLEAVLVGDFSLVFFDVEVFKLNDLPALRTDKMIMMLRVVGKFISSLSIAEIPRLGQTAPAEKIQRSVHRSQTDVRLLPGHLLEEVLRRDMAIHL